MGRRGWASWRGARVRWLVPVFVLWFPLHGRRPADTAALESLRKPIQGPASGDPTLDWSVRRAALSVELQGLFVFCLEPVVGIGFLAPASNEKGQMAHVLLGEEGGTVVCRCTVYPSMTAVCTEYKFQAAIARQRAGIPNQAQAQTKAKPKPEFWAVSVLGAGTGIHGMGIFAGRVGSVTGQRLRVG